MSDSLGIHISQEGSGVKSARDVWKSTIATFLAKFIFALTFMVPILLINNLFSAVVVSAIWGIIALAYLSYTIAKADKETPIKVIRKHVMIAVIVIIVTYST